MSSPQFQDQVVNILRNISTSLETIASAIQPNNNQEKQKHLSLDLDTLKQVTEFESPPDISSMPRQSWFAKENNQYKKLLTALYEEFNDYNFEISPIVYDPGTFTPMRSILVTKGYDRVKVTSIMCSFETSDESYSMLNEGYFNSKVKETIEEIHKKILSTEI